MTVEIEIAPFAREQTHRLLGRLALQVSRTLRNHAGDSVYELRVAIRRFSRALVVFKSCFPARDVKKIRRKLEEMMIPAREIRDCELALSMIPKVTPGRAAALKGQLERRRKDAERILTGTLRRWMERKASLKWRNRLQPSSDAGGGTAKELASKLLPDLAEQFFERGSRAADGGADEIHRFRVAAKKLRYTLELFLPLYGSGLDSWLDRVRNIQALAARIDHASALRRRLADDDGKTAAALDRQQDRQMAEFRREWTRNFADVTEASRRIAHLRTLAGKVTPVRKPMARSATARADYEKAHRAARQGA
ncbi:MAG TPA: CHAD domain-containing protein [Bryobacteraceae bacterium]|nr:CHAD domain-containing protein [Bryobacteraceae bacterium]